ncbi:hypothetical protein V496_07804 [Pseudogymnoascus sp. VKM F-4515 (FW-2607)]|nr:hypothetical protein V496_07804 [Pseudogymnoascus sp. VKM F-4515 (FW-2607)]
MAVELGGCQLTAGAPVKLHLPAVLGERHRQRRIRYLLQGADDEVGGGAAQYDHSMIWQHGSSLSHHKQTVIAVMITSITTNCMELFGGGRLCSMHGALTRRC